MRVLLATDGSRSAGQAAAWLAGFPLAATTKVLVVGVTPLPVLSTGIPSTRELEQSIVATAHAAAGNAAAVLRRRWPDTSVRVVEGDPREMILSLATQWRAGLLVLGARGLGPMKRALLGSVSTAVVHHADCPVLVVRGRRRSRGPVIVAIDGSAHARTAARFVASLPLAAGPALRLLAVVERPWAPPKGSSRTAGVARATVDGQMARRRRELQEALARLRSELGATVAVESVLRVGWPSDEIVKAARRAGLIVVGARGLGTFERLLLGSVSEHVLQHAPCPVLIVRRPASAAGRASRKGRAT